MDNRYFPGKHRPGNNALWNWLQLQITAFWLRLHLGLADAHARLARLAALTTRKGGTAGKADNLRAAFFLRGAGYEPHEHV